MKRIIVRTFTALMICCMASAVALADKRERISFDNDVQLNGTTIEKGSYDVSFDAESNEVIFKKGGKVVAKSKARVEQTEKKNERTRFATATENGGQVLRSLSFSGDKQVLVFTGGATNAGGEQ